MMNDYKNLILHPIRFYNNLALEGKKTYVIPMVVIFILSVLSSIIVRNLYIEYYSDISQGIDSIPNEIQIQGIISMVISSFAPIVVIVTKSYMVNGVVIFGGFGIIKDATTVISYAYLPAAIGAFFSSVVSVFLGHYGFNFSLGSIMELNNSATIASILLKQFDIFIIWYEILVIIGISKIYRINYTKASVFVIGTWFSWILISAGFALMII